MNRINVISKKFFNEYRNGDTFSLNTGEFASRLVGNVGEKIKLEEVVEVSTIVNETQSVEQTYISGDGIIRGDFYDYTVEGLYAGADILIEFDNGAESISATIQRITKNGSEISLDAAAVVSLDASIWAECPTRKDVVIKVTTRPTVLVYKYGINPNSSTSPNYQSPLDGAEQAYQVSDITAVFKSMRFSGKEQGSSLGTVQVKFDSTTDSYKHQFTLEHEFIIPYYTDGQFTNVQNEENPTQFQRNNSVKYGNGFFFGGDKIGAITFQDIGDDGNVGYFGDNFNGFENFYTSKDYAVSNTSNTGKIEVTETNTVTFSIASGTAAGFVGGETIILKVSKLPNSVEYANQKGAFSDIWLTDQARLTDGGGLVNSTIITNAQVVLNGVTGELDVSADIAFSVAQQLSLSDTSGIVIYYTIATQNLSDPELMDRSNVVAKADQPTQNEDIKGLITNWQPNIYKHSEFDSGTGYTDFNGWDGDLNGQDWAFTLNISEGALIIGAAFLVVSDDPTAQEFFELYRKTIPFVSQTTVNTSGQQFQVLNLDLDNSFNLPQNELLNRIKFDSIVPGAPSVTQNFTGSIGFQVPWRDWVENLDVPIDFYNSSLPNNNRNEKSSNYSGGSYEIKTCLELRIAQSVGQTSVVTTYYLLSDGSVISDFDTSGGTFTGDVKVYDLANGDEVDDLFNNQDLRIEIEFPHSSGVIPTANLEGLIWIGDNESSLEPWFLSSELDFTAAANPLYPSDTLTTGNTQFVEIVSVNNLVTLICYLDASKLPATGSRKIRGRLDSL